MSVRVNKQFDIIMSEMDEMIEDINKYHPSILKLDVDGIIMEFDDVEVIFNNGFLKIIDDDEICVVRYINIHGYSLKSFNDVMIGFNGDEMDVEIDMGDMERLWDEMYHLPSTLNPSFLSSKVGDGRVKSIIEEFICEFNGYSDIGDFNEWDKERYGELCEEFKHGTYGEINEWMSGYLWELHYTTEILMEDYKSTILNCSVWDVRDYLWINDIISHYVRDDLIDELSHNEEDDGDE